MLGGKINKVIAGIILNNETVILFNFDRPVWKNFDFPSNRCVPTTDSFVVDGILGAASKENLEGLSLGTISIGSNFPDLTATPELDSTRKKIYDYLSIPAQYFHDNNCDIHNEKELSWFSSKIVVTQISESELPKII